MGILEQIYFFTVMLSSKIFYWVEMVSKDLFLLKKIKSLFKNLYPV